MEITASGSLDGAKTESELVHLSGHAGEDY